MSDGINKNAALIIIIKISIEKTNPYGLRYRYGVLAITRTNNRKMIKMIIYEYDK